MKFLTGLVLIMTMTAVTAQAQHVNLGFKGGLNLYNIHNDNGVEYDTKAGFNLGLIGHIHINKSFALQPELVYSTQGAKYTVSGTETKIKLDYLNVPFMFQYMFDNGFRLQAGPQLGFLVHAKSETGNVSVDIKNNMKTVDFGVGFGAGYVNPATGFGVDARYNLGLSTINENSNINSTNRGFQLGFFYLLKHRN